jgi:HSP20 family protein
MPQTRKKSRELPFSKAFRPSDLLRKLRDGLSFAELKIRKICLLRTQLLFGRPPDNQLKRREDMKKDESQNQIQRMDRNPIGRRSAFFSPWFDDYFEPSRWFDEQSRFMPPAVDVDESADEYVVSADLPGMKREDINIECVGNQLTISAERKYESSEGRKQERRERFYGIFQRSFTLPTGVDAEKIQAAYEGGVLTVHVPKAEQAKPRKIAISEGKVQQKESTGNH